jgi:hypothetical protein
VFLRIARQILMDRCRVLESAFVAGPGENKTVALARQNTSSTLLAT